MIGSFGNYLRVYLIKKLDQTKYEIMKKYIFLFLIITSSTALQAQSILSRVNESNTWIKLGPNVALPMGDFGDATSLGLGLDLSVQFLETRSSGVGLKAGYINYFGKNNLDNVGVLPLAVMYRYYPESKGYFAGIEVGYAFLSNLGNFDGGAFVRPQVGFHTDDWNFFAYYDYINSSADGVSSLGAIGLAATYNIRFK